ncbi:MAG: hypothetical protein JSR97_10310 [Verrucomicrobia bacterium]|nr:hypothetical protein [Verrucomicrobiota bacterium]
MIGRGITNIDRALNEELGFKIPVLDPDYVRRFPQVFEYGRISHNGSVLSWLEHHLIGSSEHSVVSLDSAWEGIMQSFLKGLSFYRDQHDPSSLPYERPDLTVVYNNCIVLKAEAKLKELDMEDAELSLTSKFQGKAYQMFPRSSPSIIGVCTSETLAKIFKVSYNFELQRYESVLLPNAVYRVQLLEDRVNFLVDMLKLLKWVCTVNQPIESFHLVPNVRTPTSNRHYITWNGRSIIKEFKGRVVDLQYIQRIYQQHLANVEYGEVFPNRSIPTIQIDRIGRRLKDAIAKGYSKQTALEHVEAGMKQLHQLGLGHGDISLNNVFVDDQGIAFLDDLEYSAPVDSIVARQRRPPDASNRMTLGEFDLWKFDQLKVEIAKL